jgi:hypothetical protein
MKICGESFENNDVILKIDVQDENTEQFRNALSELLVASEKGYNALKDMSEIYRAKLMSKLDKETYILMEKLIWCIIELERKRTLSDE